jgi:toxin ParE1/3/4
VRIVRISDHAEEDLAQAAEYLDQQTGNPSFGDRLLNELAHVMDLIAEYPWMGRERADLHDGLRGFPHGSYVIYWRIHDDVVEIVRVLHQKQDVERAFDLR